MTRDEMMQQAKDATLLHQLETGEFPDINEVLDCIVAPPDEWDAQYGDPIACVQEGMDAAFEEIYHHREDQ